MITVDNGPGHRLTIVRDPGDPDSISIAGEPEIITYKDASGGMVKVYADHPVNRTDAEAQVVAAERHADQARLAGRRAIEEGRRAAAEGRRQAQAAGQEAARAQEAGLKAAQEGRREAELGGRKAERARAEGERAIEEARGERDQLRPDVASADRR